jgi:hypothetical protein
MRTTIVNNAFKTILAGHGRNDEEHWIIVDQHYDEYVDSEGDNLVFYSKQEAEEYIKGITND